MDLSLDILRNDDTRFLISCAFDLLVTERERERERESFKENLKLLSSCLSPLQLVVIFYAKPYRAYTDINSLFEH
jgi:hypothetical protein